MHLVYTRYSFLGIFLTMLFVLGLFDLSYGEKINNAVYDSLLIKLKLIKEDSNKVDFVLSETLNKFHNHYGIQIIERVLPLALDNKNLERAIICYLRMGAIENARSRPNDAITVLESVEMKHTKKRGASSMRNYHSLF